MKNKINGKNNIIPNLRKFFYLILLQALIAAVWTLLIPNEPENAVILGYSLKRLALLVPILLLSVLAVVGINMVRVNKTVQGWFIDEAKKSRTARFFIFGGFSLSLIVWIFALSYHYFRFVEDLGLYIRLLPNLTFFLLLGLEAVLFVPLSLYRVKRSSPTTPAFWKKPIFWISMVVFVGLLLVVEITSVGKSPVYIAIVSLGVPLLEGQILLLVGALWISSITTFSFCSLPDKRKIKLTQLDGVIFFLIWIIAVLLWMGQPLPDHNYFAPSVQPPNYVKYPFSDAEQYDYNSLFVLFGALDDFVISKPLYVSFLTILHFIGGFSYSNIILLQTIVLGLFPAVLYLIGKEFSFRLGGIALALFVILRELNTIMASSMANVSNSKLFLSAMPATLIVSVLVLVFIRWFKSPVKRFSRHVIAAGGLIGVLILIRIQTLLLIPFVLLLAIIRYYGDLKNILLSSLVLLLMIGLVLMPVLVRNHSITEVYWVDNPSSAQSLYTYFIDEDNDSIEVPKAETSGDTVERNLSVISSALINNFGGVFFHTADNFLHNAISTLLIFPVRLGNSPNLIDFVTIRTPFWMEVYSQPNVLNLLVLSLNFFIIAFGITAMVKKHSWAALVIIMTYLVYNLSAAVVRLSGWRFIQPVDWIVIVFYAVGLAEIVKWVSGTVLKWEFNEDDLCIKDKHNGSEKKKSYGWMNVLLIFGFFLAGGFIPLRESFLPKQVPEVTRAEICDQIDQVVEKSIYSNYRHSISEFCSSAKIKAIAGYAFYPRFFYTGEGYYTRTQDTRYGIQDYSRIVFRVIGQQSALVHIKTDRKDVPIQNKAIVYVLQRGEFREGAQLVVIINGEPSIVISSPILTGEEAFSID